MACKMSQLQYTRKYRFDIFGFSQMSSKPLGNINKVYLCKGIGAAGFFITTGFLYVSYIVCLGGSALRGDFFENTKWSKPIFLQTTKTSHSFHISKLEYIVIIRKL